MTTTGLETFDTTVQTTNVWLDDLMRFLDWSDRHKAWHALRVVLHALRDRLPVDEAVQLSAQLPMLVRGMFFEGWTPHGKPVKERSRDEYLAHVTDGFLLDPDADAEGIARAVFRVIARHVSAGEIRDVKATLPAEIRALWI